MRLLRHSVFWLSLVIKMISKENIILSFLVNKGMRDLHRLLFLFSIVLAIAFWRRFILGRDP